MQQEEKHLKQALTRCKYPAWAMNKVKMKTKATSNNNSKDTKNSGNNIQKPHMMIPYYKGSSERIKKTSSEHGVQVYSKEAILSRTSWWLQKTKTPSRSKVESYIDTNVTGWNVMRNTFKSPQEHLEKGITSAYITLRHNICPK